MKNGQKVGQILISCFAKCKILPKFHFRVSRNFPHFRELRKRNFLATLARIVHRKSLTFLFELNTGFLLSKSLKYFLKVSSFREQNLSFLFVWKYLSLGRIQFRLRVSHILKPDPNYFYSDPQHTVFTLLAVLRIRTTFVRIRIRIRILNNKKGII